MLKHSKNVKKMLKKPENQKLKISKTKNQKVLCRQHSNCFCFVHLSVFLFLCFSFYLFFFLFFFFLGGGGGFSSFFHFFAFFHVPSLFVGWCCVSPLLFGDVLLGFFPLWVVLLFTFFCLVVLPSPPLGCGACLLSSVGWCCLVSSFLLGGVVVFPRTALKQRVPAREGMYPSTA